MPCEYVEGFKISKRKKRRERYGILHRMLTIEKTTVAFIYSTYIMNFIVENVAEVFFTLYSKQKSFNGLLNKLKY